MDNQQFQPVQNQSIWTIILPTIIITVLIVGGGVWWWQKSSFEKEKEDLRQQIEELENQVSETSDWQTYQNKEYGFEVKYPESWEFKEDSFEASIIKSSAYVDRFSFYTDSIKFEIQVWPAPYEKVSISAVPGIFHGDELKEIEVNGIKGGYRIGGDPGGDIKSVWLPDISDLNRSYIFTIQEDCYLSICERYLNLFDQILSTFKFQQLSETQSQQSQGTQRQEKVKITKEDLASVGFDISTFEEIDMDIEGYQIVSFEAGIVVSVFSASNFSAEELANFGQPTSIYPIVEKGIYKDESYTGETKASNEIRREYYYNILSGDTFFNFSYPEEAKSKILNLLDKKFSK